MKQALIMTATIQPPKMAPELTRTDPLLRRSDYLRAFHFYKDKLGQNYQHLVFADNSNQDVSDFLKLAKDDPRIAVLSFEANDHPPFYGRGFGEMRLINHVLAAIPELTTEYNRVWKITGRYQLKNVNTLLRSGRSDDEVICHCRNYPRRWVDMYCFGWNASGRERVIADLHKRLRSDIIDLPPEIVLRAILDDMQAIRGLRVSRRFQSTPVIEGVRGVDGADYLDKAGRRKLRQRQIAHRLAPWLWI